MARRRIVSTAPLRYTGQVFSTNIKLWKMLRLPPHIMETFLLWLDPVFVLPFRVIPHPEVAYIFGTGCLALIAVLLGLVTLSLANRLHAKRLKKYQDQMQHYHKLSEQALSTEGKEAFKAVNRQGHEAFGYHFSLSGALFVASIWPVPIIFAWMHLRFGDLSPVLPFNLPLFGNQPGMVFWFILYYIPLRMYFSRVWRKLQLRKREPLSESNIMYP